MDSLDAYALGPAAGAARVDRRRWCWHALITGSEAVSDATTNHARDSAKRILNVRRLLTWAFRGKPRPTDYESPAAERRRSPKDQPPGRLDPDCRGQCAWLTAPRMRWAK